ncbi:MAG TPA: hypothetical protein VJ385_19785 [Fibrobacteria bacterium]|nr:hypothetical protein [Fibrobacteria bacterium]
MRREPWFSVARPFAMSFMRWGLAALALAAAATVGAQTAANGIAQLKKPGTGNDAAARLQLRTLTNTGYRPGAESERQAQENALLAGLANPVDWEIKSFLMEELRFGGKSASIAPLAAYLADTNLCGPAKEALTGISVTLGADAVVSAVRAALPASVGKCRTVLLQAAGSLRDTAASTITELIKDAASADRGARAMALRGLANIGDARGKAALAQAMAAADPLDAYHADALNLIFARRLAERGLRSDGLALANSVKSAAQAVRRGNVVIDADSAIGYIQGLPTGVHRGDAFVPGGPLLARAGSVLRLEWPGSGSYRVRVANLQGRFLREWAGAGNLSLAWDASALPAGVYHLMVERAEAARTFTFLPF